MDISKKELNRIIAEEVQKELQEQGLDEILGGAWDKIKSAFGTEVGGTPRGPDTDALHTAPTAQANPAQQKQLERIGKAITPRIRKMINIGIRTPSMFQMFLKQIILPNVADVVTDTMRAKVFRNMATSETKSPEAGEKETAPAVDPTAAQSAADQRKAFDTRRHRRDPRLAGMDSATQRQQRALAAKRPLKPLPLSAAEKKLAAMEPRTRKVAESRKRIRVRKRK